MYRNVIVGYDGSAQADDAVALAKQVADATGGSLTLATVFYLNSRLGGRDPILQGVEAEQTRKLDEVASASGAGTEIIVSTSAARGLHWLAEKRDADLIVVGSAHHGRAAQVFAGNVGVALLHDSPCAVAIAPHGYAEATGSGITQVTVGYDGSPDAHMALDDAAELAAAADVPLKVVTVAETPPIVYGKGGGPNYSWQALSDDIKQIMRQRLDEAMETLPADLEAEGTLIEGEAPSELAGAADGGLLLLGSRGYGPVRRVILGSTSADLMRFAPCPVIVHPRSAAAGAPAFEARATASA